MCVKMVEQAAYLWKNRIDSGHLSTTPCQRLFYPDSHINMPPSLSSFPYPFPPTPLISQWVQVQLQPLVLMRPSVISSTPGERGITTNGTPPCPVPLFISLTQLILRLIALNGWIVLLLVTPLNACLIRADSLIQSHHVVHQWL